MGLALGMGMGTIPTDKSDKGMDFEKNFFMGYTTRNYTIIFQSSESSNHISPSLTSGRDAPAFRSSKLTNPNLLQ